MRIKLVFAVLTFVVAPASANTVTFVVQGYVADGYDNGGYFGSQFANLSGLPFSVAWTGIGVCNCYGGPLINANSPPPITGALLTIGDTTVDLWPFGGPSNLFVSEWFDRVIQVQMQYSGFNSYLTTWNTNTVGVNHNVGGGFTLQDGNHLQTSAELIITDFHSPPPVPGPMAGDISWLLRKLIAAVRK